MNLNNENASWAPGQSRHVFGSNEVSKAWLFMVVHGLWLVFNASWFLVGFYITIISMSFFVVFCTIGITSLNKNNIESTIGITSLEKNNIKIKPALVFQQPCPIRAER